MSLANIWYRNSLNSPLPFASRRPNAAMTMIRLGPAVRFAVLYGACFAGIGVLMPFFPVWLETRGLDASAIGVVLSLPILTRVLVTAPLMSLIDGGLSAPRLLTAGSLVLVLAYGALWFAA